MRKKRTNLTWLDLDGSIPKRYQTQLQYLCWTFTARLFRNKRMPKWLFFVFAKVWSITVSRNSTLFSQFFPSPPCSNLLLSLQGDFRRNIFRNVGINVMYALSLAEEPCSRTNQNCSERWGCLENSETLSCKTGPDSQIDHYVLKDSQTIPSKPSFSMIQGSCFWFSSWLCPNPTSSTASIESTVTCEAKFGRQVTISFVELRSL